MAARSPAICRPPPRRLGHLQASSPNRTSQHGPPGTGSCTQQLANWRQQILLRTSAPIQRQASGHATAVSKRRNNLPSHFAACRSVCVWPLQRFRDRDQPRTARMHPHKPLVKSSCDGTCDASNKPIPECSTGSMRPSHVVLISHAIPCSTGSMHSSHVILINRTTKFFPLPYLPERSTASPHAPRAHPRPPPAPRPSATSFLHFFAPHVKYPATGLTSGPD